MNNSANMSAIARRLGLDLSLDTSNGALRLKRHTLTVELHADLLEHLDPATLPGRHLLWTLLLGVRLGLDHRLCAFDPAAERVGASALYGERFPQLLSPLSVAWFEALSGARALSERWLIDDLQRVYIRAIGKYLHVLSAENLIELSISAQKLAKDAHHALFYGAYRLRPAEKHSFEGGELRVFRTTEGLGASRAQLLPDFDYDAAREAGSFSIPCRDAMIIARPAACEYADLAREALIKLSRSMLLEADFPLSARIFLMDHQRAYPAPAAEPLAPSSPDGLPPAQDMIKAVMPAPDVKISDERIK